MKALFANMDLYKAIILGCVVLLPVGGAWAYYEHQQLQKGQVAVGRATSDIEKIALLKKQVEEQVLNDLRTAGTEDPFLYFERVVNNSVDTSKGEPLKKNDYQIKPQEQPGETRPKRGAKRIFFTDLQVTLDFRRNGKEPFPLKRDFLNAVAFNAESQQQRWKLRNLTMRNATILGLSGSKPPPPEVDDEWLVSDLTFVWRQQTRTK